MARSGSGRHRPTDRETTRSLCGTPTSRALSCSSDRKVLAFVTGPSRAEIERAEQREYDEGMLVDATIDPTQALYRGGFVHGRRASQRLVGRWYQHDGLLWRAPRQRHRVDFSDADGNRRGAGYGPSTGSSLFVVDRAADARARQIRSLGHAA